MTSRWIKIGLRGIVMAAISVGVSSRAWSQTDSPLFVSFESIEIRDGLTASPYPSTIGVAGLEGVVFRVNVALYGLAHSFPDDIDILLVSPWGQGVIVMSDVGGGTDIGGLFLEFSDFAPATLPDSGELLSGVFRPTNVETNDTFPTPAPPGPFGDLLRDFNGGNPNGTWSLYIVDDAGSDSGQLISGWSVQFQTVNPVNTADLALGVVAPETVMAGDSLNYSLTVSNLGPHIAARVRLRAVLPLGVKFESAEPDRGNCNFDDGVVNCNLGNFLAGERIKVVLRTTPTLPVTVTNEISVVADGFDLDPFNSMLRVLTAVTAANVADLVVAIEDIPDPSNLGDNFSYIIGVTNQGPLAGTGVILTNRLPANVTFIRAETTQGSCERVLNNIVCSLGELAMGSNATVSIVLRGNLIGTLTNSVWVGANEPDLTPAQVTETTSVILPSDLQVLQTDSNDPAGVGSNLTYRVVIENNGPGSASEVVLVDTLPLQSTFISASTTQGSCEQAGGIVTCFLGQLDEGDFVEVEVVVRPNLLGTFINTAVVSGREEDVDLENNFSTERTTVFPTIGNGILITPSTNALELATAVTAGGSTGIRVTETRLAAHSFPLTNFFGEVLSPSSSGLYTVANPPFTYGLMGLGVVISSGDVNDYNTGPNLSSGNGIGFGIGATTNQEALLDPITASGGRTFRHFDVTQLDINFDLLEGFDTVRFDVVFGSEEYPEFVNDSFVDGFGIYLNGQNIAFTQGRPININHPDMKAIAGTELDGVVAPNDNPILTFTAFVGAGTSNNTLTFIVADTSDSILDTTVFISSLQGAVEPRADMIANVTADNTRPIVGSNVTYTAVVTNLGPDTATSVVLSNRLPAGVDFVSAVPTRGSCALIQAGLVVCEIPSLGSGTSARVTLVGSVRQEGSMTNTVSVGAAQQDLDRVNNTASVTRVALHFGTFFNPAEVVIFDGAPASPYPSSVVVSGVGEVLTGIAVLLSDLFHPFSADLDVLLQGPTGRSVLLMSDAGANHALNGIDLRFVDSAPLALPISTSIVSGTYRPTDYPPADLLLAPAPQSGYETGLAGFIGTNPNGVWNLYVYDDQGGDSGLIKGGWRLELVATPGGARLNFSREAAVGVVSWPGTPGAYRMEESLELPPSADWVPVLGSQTATNGVNRVTVNLSGSARYYRLVRLGP